MRNIKLLLVVVFLFGCLHEKNKDSESVNFTVIHEGYYASGTHRQIEIVETRERINEIASYDNFGIENVTGVSNIDFSIESALFVHMGEQGTPGPSIKIDKMYSDGNFVFVEIGHYPAPTNEPTTFITAHPYTIVKFKKQSKSIIFNEYIKNEAEK